MLSVNSNPTTPTVVTQPQSTVAFKGKPTNLPTNLRHVSKATLDSLKHYKETVANMPERKDLFFFANIVSSIKSWFKDFKIMLKKPKDFIEYNPFKEKVDYSSAHSIKAGVEGVKSAISNTKELIEISTPQYNNKKTRALMEFHETMAKKLFKK